MARLIESPPNDTTKYLPKLQLIIEAIKRGTTANLKAQLLAGIEEVVTSQQLPRASMEALRERWRSWLPDHRILCLTESPSHAAMWYHYADQYRGVVLEFRCLDELDSALLAARPVTYPLSKPTIYTAEGWAELLCLQPKASIEALLDAATYTKAPDWSYEAEWRLASLKRSGETGLFGDYPFFREELAAVYFGPMISSEDRLSLRITAGAYPLARLRDVAVGMSREFSFRDVDA